MVNRPPRFTTLRSLMWNANGVLSRKDELMHFLADQHIDVAFLCETHLNETQRFSVPNYRVYRSDRPTRGGGTALLIKNCIPHARVPHRDLRSLEETTVIVHGATGDLFLTSVYRPPGIVVFQPIHDGFGMQGGS